MFIALYSILDVLKCLVLNLGVKIHIWSNLRHFRIRTQFVPCTENYYDTGIF